MSLDSNDGPFGARTGEVQRDRMIGVQGHQVEISTDILKELQGVNANLRMVWWTLVILAVLVVVF